MKRNLPKTCPLAIPRKLLMCHTRNNPVALAQKTGILAIYNNAPETLCVMLCDEFKHAIEVLGNLLGIYADT
jgi:hypothetical protein